MRSFRNSVTNCWAKLAALMAASLLAGCHTGVLNDPNDISTAGPRTALVIQTQLQSAAESFNLRRLRGEVDERRYRQFITDIAQDYVSQATDTTLTNENAPVWGEIYITAKQWDKAEAAWKHALDADKILAPKDYVALGRYITDLLRLARIKAEKGEIRKAIQLTRESFADYGKAKAPILPAVLYEIVPAGRGKGYDAPLADLLKDAIRQHEETIVDPNTDAGRNFLIARPHHIFRAWKLVSELYQAAGRVDMAQDAMREANKISSETIRL